MNIGWKQITSRKWELATDESCLVIVADIPTDQPTYTLFCRPPINRRPESYFTLKEAQDAAEAAVLMWCEQCVTELRKTTKERTA